MAKMWSFLSGSQYCKLKQQSEQTGNFSLKSPKLAEQRPRKQKIRAGLREGFLVGVLEKYGNPAVS